MNDELKVVRTLLKRSHVFYGEEAHALLRPIAASLLDLKVSTVELEYSGVGDEGAIESSSFLPKSIEVPDELRRLVEDWVYAVLPDGWEIDEGGQGTVTIDVRQAVARINHEQNIVTTESKPYQIG